MSDYFVRCVFKVVVVWCGSLGDALFLVYLRILGIASERVQALQLDCVQLSCMQLNCISHI